MNYRIIRKLQEHHIAQLVRLYQGEFWCQTRQPDDVLRMLRNTDIIVGVVDENDQLCAFSRLLTDFVYKATLYDVIVAPSKRQQKLGNFIMHTVLELPELRNVEHIDLTCLADMFPFYRRFGFSDQLNGLQQMRRLQRNAAPTEGPANNTESGV